MGFKRPRGTRDLLPEEMEKRRFMEGVIRSVFEGYGYREVKTPTFENLDLLTTKSGEEIKQHLYHFKDKGGREIALRPELTAAVMRLYIEAYQQRPKPRKLYYFGNCFRYERPQSGRYREFWQAGLEHIGSSHPEAEAEVIAVAVDALEKLGLRDFQLHIGHIGVLRKIMEGLGISEANQNQFMAAIDKGEAGELEGLFEEFEIGDPQRVLISEILQLVGGPEIIERAKELLQRNEEALGELMRLEEVLDKLQAFGIGEYKIDMGIARGLDYYTGTVFEIYAPRLGAEKQICGGGTYSLVEVLGGKKTPTCGFAFGFDRMILALEKEKYKFDEVKKQRYLVVTTSNDLINEAIKVARSIREWRNIPCEVDSMRRKLGKALPYAGSEGISHAVIIGEEEYRAGKIIIKELATGEQETLDIKEVGNVET